MSFDPLRFTPDVLPEEERRAGVRSHLEEVKRESFRLCQRARKRVERSRRLVRNGEDALFAAAQYLAEALRHGMRAEHERLKAARRGSSTLVDRARLARIR